MTDFTPQTPSTSSVPGWVPLSRSTFFLLSHFRLLILSLFLFLITLAITWLFYRFSSQAVDQYLGAHFLTRPEATGIWGWIKYQGWALLKLIFIVISKIISFYIAFLTAYSLTAPGYALLSASTEKIDAGSHFDAGENFSLDGLLVDLWEGCKIGLFGILVTGFAIAVNFVPVAGQVLVFLLYGFYSCLMFIDYPASRRRWSLGKKIKWIANHWAQALRLGLLPALISMIPVLNMFVMALFFPLFTVHATLNFRALEDHRQS